MKAKRDLLILVTITMIVATFYVAAVLWITDGETLDSVKRGQIVVIGVLLVPVLVGAFGSMVMNILDKEDE